MKQQLIAACAAAVLGAGLTGVARPVSASQTSASPASATQATSSGALGSLLSMNSVNLFRQLGGMQKVAGLARDFVGSSLKDPLLSGLTAGKQIDPTTTSGKVSSQLCAMLGGGCQAPLSNAQVASAASKVSPQQASAISQHFRSSLQALVANPAVRAAVISALGSKIPGVLAGLL